MLATHWNWTAALASLSLALAGAIAACGSDSDTFETSSGEGASSAGPGPTSTTSANGGASSASGPAVGSGGSSSTTGAGGAGCKGLGDACSDCAAMSCNALYCKCYDNAACGMLVSCAQACASGDMQCAQTCLTQNQAGISDALLLGDCVAAGSCAAQCPTAAVADPCEKCALETCPMQMNKCLANAECYALILCVQGCGSDAFCQLGCANDHSGGQDDATAVQDCIDPTCNGQCG